MKPITCAIFDLDGTVLDSNYIWIDAGELYLKSLGITAEPKLGAKLLQMNMNDGALYLQKNYSLELSLNEINKGIMDVLKDVYSSEIKPKNGIIEILEYLNEMGIPCTIATSSDREMFLGCLEKYNLIPYFKRIYTCSELNTSKKDPFIFETAAEHFSSSPENTVVFEDSPMALKTAKLAGFRTIGIYDQLMQQNTNIEEAKSFCDCFCHDFEQARDYLSQALDNSFAAL